MVDMVRRRERRRRAGGEAMFVILKMESIAFVKED